MSAREFGMTRARVAAAVSLAVAVAAALAPVPATAAPETGDTGARVARDTRLLVAALNESPSARLDPHGDRPAARVSARIPDTDAVATERRKFEARFAQEPTQRSTRWLPFFRHEPVAPGTAQAEGVAGGVPRFYERQALGIRHDLDSRTAVSVEFARTSEQALGRQQKISEVRAQFVLRY